VKKTKSAFVCQICGQCCQGSGGIVATLKEQQRMADYLGMDISGFQMMYVQRKGDKFFIRNNDQGWCIFFNTGKGCTVHPAKPRTCRAWPFFRGNLMDESSFEMAREYCPGIDPDTDFEEFVRLGVKYLQEHGLGQELEDDAGNALRTSDIA